MNFSTGMLAMLFYCAVSSMRSETKKNIVLILTDDQDVELGGLEPMQKTMKLLAAQGAQFTNAYTTTPICCPSRSSILTGVGQWEHKVLNNSIDGGCSSLEWQRKFETIAFPVHLSKAGYRTFYVGKYLNQYGNTECGGPEHVPPGWTSWVGLIGNSKYYNYELSIDGKRNSSYKDQYLTNVIKEFGRKFIKEEENSEHPFLLVLAPPAPHSPFTPETKYEGKFAGIKVPRTIQFNHPNNSGKHWLVKMKPTPLNEASVKFLDEAYAKRWESLLSVDDLVETIYNELISINQLDNTYIIFTSDNGYHLGQFSMPLDKRQMYEFDIKVPLLVRGPGVKPNLKTPSPVLLLDIAPTLYYIAGVEGVATEGKSFLPVPKSLSRSFNIEYHGEREHAPGPQCPWNDHCDPQVECRCQDSQNNTYFCNRRISSNYNTIICFFNDSQEMYDLIEDPFQMKNLIGPQVSLNNET